MSQHLVTAWSTNYSSRSRQWRIFNDFLGHCWELKFMRQIDGFHDFVSSTDMSVPQTIHLVNIVIEFL